MERLASLDEYSSLLLQYKRGCRRYYSNNYLSLDMVNRYIDLKRIYYEINGTMLSFITDEEKYYRQYIHTIPEADVVFHKMDKPILIRNVYKQDRKPVGQPQVERNLLKSGFELCDRTVQILAKPMEMRQEIQEKYGKAISFLQRMGIKLAYADRRHIASIMELRNTEALFRNHYFLYETRSEIEDSIKKGHYRCAFDANEELCAVQQFSVEDNAVQGNWLAVKEEYRVKYGIGNAMAYHSFLYAIECGLENYFGWVDRSNEKSIKYHISIGYKFTGKYADEWLLI